MSNYATPGTPPAGYTQPGYPPPQQPSGCGCGGCLGKFLILLGAVFLLMIVVCCGGGYFVFDSFKKSSTQQPAEVRAISDEIAPMNVPAPLEPKGGGRYKLPIFGPLGEGAIYAAPDKKAVLIVASFSDAFGPQFKDQMMKNLEAAPNQQRPANENDELNEELKDVKTTTVERTIRGEKAEFHISEGIGVRHGKKKIKVNGAFQGKTGPALLVIMADEETLSRKEVDDIIQSIDGDDAAEKKPASD